MKQKIKQYLGIDSLDKATSILQNDVEELNDKIDDTLTESEIEDKIQDAINEIDLEQVAEDKVDEVIESRVEEAIEDKLGNFDQDDFENRLEELETNYEDFDPNEIDSLQERLTKLEEIHEDELAKEARTQQLIIDNKKLRDEVAQVKKDFTEALLRLQPTEEQKHE